MKKKLLAVVLSVVMIAALLVPMIGVHAAAPTLEVTIGELDYSRANVGTGFIGVPIMVTGNSENLFCARFLVISDKAGTLNNALVVLPKAADTTLKYEVVDPFGGDSEFLTYSKTVGSGAKDMLSKDLTQEVIDAIPDGYTGYRIVLDGTTGCPPAGTGLLATVYFAKPAVGETANYKLIWSDSTNGTSAKHEFTVTKNTVSYTAECTDHDMEPVAGSPADCENDGVVAHNKCSVCGYTDVKETVIPALGHDWKDADGDVADCENPGTEPHKVCSRCDITDPATPGEVPALGHDYEPVAEVPAECEKDGVAAHEKCSRCDTINPEKPADVIPALGHLAVVDDGYDATCEEPGLTDGSHCGRTDCGEVLVAQEPIAALGHDFTGEVTIVEEPTAAKGGKIEVKCVRFDECDTIDTIETDPLTSKVQVAEDAVVTAGEAVLPADLVVVEADVEVKLDGKNEALATFAFAANSVASLEDINGNVSIAVKELDGKYNNIAVVAIKADGTYEAIESKIENGNIVFDAPLDGVYAVIGEKVVATTGDNFNVALYIALSVIALAAIAFVAKKKLAR